MSADDDRGCPGHEWLLVGVALISGHGAPTEYECIHCGAVLYRGPDDPFPETVRVD